uniref:BZIP domain-containing protein n=1 Tax=Spongospora subterranea TaxID=70186 RepID=A0A0H5R8C3_9EUKA|eukprot:CRZ09952.1 hypothetical protein [Spongospora subterranea]
MTDREERYSSKLSDMSLEVDDLGHPRLDLLLAEDGNFLTNVDGMSPMRTHDSHSHDSNGFAPRDQSSCIRRVQTCPIDLSSMFVSSPIPRLAHQSQQMDRYTFGIQRDFDQELHQHQQHYMHQDLPGMSMVENFTSSSQRPGLSPIDQSSLLPQPTPAILILPLIGPNTFPMSKDQSGLRRIQTAPVSLVSLNSTESESQKLAKKAESARLCRRRKKEFILSLEADLSRLTARLAELQSSCDPKQILSKLASDQNAIKSRMAELLKQNPVPADELSNLLEEFIRNSRNRQNSAEFYIDRASKNLQPSPQDKVIEWALSITAPGSQLQFPNDALLLQAQLSPEQYQVLQRYHKPFQDLYWTAHQLGSRLRKLSEGIHRHLVAQHEHIDRLRAIFTPEQVAKFCLWVDSNPVATQMLSTLWNT